jgi:hypothetical protein
MANELIIITKVVNALKSIVENANVGTTNLYPMKWPGEKQSPSVNFGVDLSKEEPLGSGNFWVRAEVSVHTPAALDAEDDPQDVIDASDAITANVFAALNVDNLADLMMAAVPGLTVFGFGEEREIDVLEKGDHWAETWRRMIYCCGTEF